MNRSPSPRGRSRSRSSSVDRARRRSRSRDSREPNSPEDLPRDRSPEIADRNALRERGRGSRRGRRRNDSLDSQADGDGSGQVVIELDPVGVEDQVEALPLAAAVPAPRTSTEVVIAKQGERISDEQRKSETDLKKYFFVQQLADRLNARNARVHADFIAILRGFFVKNAPAAFNTTNAEIRGRPRAGFSRRLDRDFTFERLKPKRRESLSQVSYHRTTGGDTHFWRGYLSGKLRTLLTGKRSAQVYSSFEVTLTANGTIELTYLPGLRFLNPVLLGAKANSSSQPLAAERGTRQINEVTLTFWQNKASESGAAQARANTGGMLPNLVQTFMILQQLNKFDLQPDLRPDNDRLLPFRRFTMEERQNVYASIRDRVPRVARYKTAFLNNRRRLIADLGATIKARPPRNGRTPFGNIQVVLTPGENQTRGFYQYPGLILERVGTKSSKDIQPFLKALTDKLRELTELSIGNRQSFGFAAITTSDLTRSVRIWPGLIPAATFKKLVLKALEKIGIIGPEPPVLAVGRPAIQIALPEVHEESPLEMALKETMHRALARYINDPKSRLADNELPDSDLNETRRWLNDRVLSNLIKARTLLAELQKSNDPRINVILRAIKTLENLNEYDVLQAGLEEAEEQAVSRADRKRQLLQGIEKVNKDRFDSLQNRRWKVHSTKITASGMAAYRTVVSLTGKVGTSSRLYFEARNLNNGMDKLVAIGDDRFAQLPMVTRAVDLAYNFTNVEETTVPEVHKDWGDVSPNSPNIVIFDATNTTLEENIAAIPQNADFVVLFESLSKHFQFGGDKTTLGKVMVLERQAPRQLSIIGAMSKRFGLIQHTPLTNGFLNYVLLQESSFDRIPAPLPVPQLVVAPQAFARPGGAGSDRAPGRPPGRPPGQSPSRGGGRSSQSGRSAALPGSSQQLGVGSPVLDPLSLLLNPPLLSNPESDPAFTDPFELGLAALPGITESLPVSPPVEDAAALPRRVPKRNRSPEQQRRDEAARAQRDRERNDAIAIDLEARRRASRLRRRFSTQRELAPLGIEEIDFTVDAPVPQLTASQQAFQQLLQQQQFQQDQLQAQRLQQEQLEIRRLAEAQARFAAEQRRAQQSAYMRKMQRAFQQSQSGVDPILNLPQLGQESQPPFFF